METALYSAAVAQEDIMQGAEEEGLPPSDGFLVADTNQQLTLEQMEHMIDALDLNPLYVGQHVKTERPDAVVDSLPAMRASVQQLPARFADKAAHKAGLSRLHKL